MITEFCRALKTNVQLAKELEDLSEEMMSQIDTFQKERLQALLDIDKYEYILKLEEMKQAVLEYKEQLDSLSNSMDENKLAVFSLESQVVSLKESMLNLFFSEKYLEFDKREDSCSFGRMNQTKSDLKQTVKEVDISLNETKFLEDIFE